MKKPETKEIGAEKVKKLMKVLQQYPKAHVTIGVHEDAGMYSEGSPPPSVVEVALWMEFGTRTVPERSYLRTAIDENTSKINAWREEVINGILDGKYDVPKALEIMGTRIKDLIQNKMKDNLPPAYGTGKKPNTTDRIQELQNQKKAKGWAPVTLIASGLLLRSVLFQVHLE